MSIVAPEQPITAPAAAPPAPPAVAAHPTIAATRKLLTSRAASLAFTVSAGGLPYWEVLLFTDRSLVDPKSAARRSPSSFYASRQDGGLRKAAPDGNDVFLVPSAVLRGFAAATPKPSAIYYTVAAYADASASSPVFPEPPELLAHDAPFVQVAADFTPDVVDSVLGVSARRLRVVAQALDAAPAPAAPTPAPAPAPAPAAAAPAPAPAAAPAATPPQQPAVDPAQDAAAGEDGYAYYAKHPDEIHVQEAVQPTPAPTHAQHDDRHDDQVYDDGYGDYDDGWEHEEGWAGAQSASFPADFAEPAALVDADTAELERVEPLPYHDLDEPGTAAPAAAVAPALVLTIDDKRALLAQLAGDAGLDRYGAVNADGEHRGRFGPDDPAYRHHHVGLSFGIVQFTQDSGDLGRLLTMMKQRDEAAFARIFGEHADELIAVTTAAGPPASECPDGRSARTQPVGGADLWEEPWLSRFRQAGAEPAFQAAQNELAASLFIDPMLRFSGDLGLDTDRALAIVVDRAAQLGCDRAKQWIVAAVGPIQTDALRQQALAAVGAADLATFQRAHALPPDNLFGPDTHAALVGALRALGSAAPIPLPTVEQMLDSLVRRADADGAYWAASVVRLRGATGFTDKPYPRS